MYVDVCMYLCSIMRVCVRAGVRACARVCFIWDCTYATGYLVHIQGLRKPGRKVDRAMEFSRVCFPYASWRRFMDFM